MLHSFYPVMPDLSWLERIVPLGVITVQLRLKDAEPSEINRQITKLELSQEIKIGYFPVFPDVHISVLSRGTDSATSKQIFEESCQKVEQAIGHDIYGTDQDELESIVGSLLMKRGLSLSAAESCSGGLLSHRITRIPGSSAYFSGGAVTYSNDMKINVLRVAPDVISQHGAVSHEVAGAMARGMMDISGSDLAISITGVAGPDGGTPEKPVGTVYFGIGDQNEIVTSVSHFRGDRHRIQALAVHTGLNMLRLHLLQSR